MSDGERDPERHYDRITPVWDVVLGPDFHHGLFARGDETLSEATRALTERLAGLAGLERGRPAARSIRLLDVGCGVGGPARVLAGEYGAEVTANHDERGRGRRGASTGIGGGPCRASPRRAAHRPRHGSTRWIVRDRLDARVGPVHRAPGAAHRRSRPAARTRWPARDR